MRLQQKCGNHKFHPNSFFIFLFSGIKWYLHGIDLVFTLNTSFTGYAADIFNVISNLYFQRSKFGRKSDKFRKRLEEKNIVKFRVYSIECRV